MATGVLTLAVLLGLGACGSSTDSNTVSKTGAKAKRVVAPGERPPSDMVAAVGAGKVGPPVELKFELRAPPQAGQPLDVDIAVVADTPAIERIYGKFSAGEGLDLVAGTELEAVAKPSPGTVIRHVLQVLPRQDGIFTLTATVGVDFVNDSMTRAFSIPIIVGAGLAEAAPKAPDAGEPAAAGRSSAH